MTTKRQEDSRNRCFLVVDDPKYIFANTTPVFDGKGAILLEIEDASIAESLIELFKKECPECTFDLVAIRRNRISAIDAVLADRQVDLAIQIWTNLDWPEYRTGDPLSVRLSKYAQTLSQLYDELNQAIKRGSDRSGGSSSGVFAIGNFPPLSQPTTVADALSQLAFVLERHRLVFLYSVAAGRVNPLAIRSRSGIHERVSHDDIAGWNEALSVDQIDSEGKFLFEIRRYIDAFADKAYSTFGRGGGAKPDVDGASFPYWILEDGLVVHVQESSETVLLAARLVREADAAGNCTHLIHSAVSVAIDNGQSRWYSSQGVRWEYVAELESAIRSIKLHMIVSPPAISPLGSESGSDPPSDELSMRSSGIRQLELPHSFMRNYLTASRLLQAAVEKWRRNLRVDSPDLFLSAIERFVHELEQVPAWFDELAKRSCAVRAICGPDSDYSSLRDAALLSHSTIHERVSVGKLSIDFLRGSITENPKLVDLVNNTRSAIRNLLSDETIELTDISKAAFQHWHDECRRIQLEFERLSVDGCLFLLQVYESFSTAASADALAFQSLMRSSLGGGYLSEILTAVHALAEFASSHPPVMPQEMPDASSAASTKAQIADVSLSPRAKYVLVAMIELKAFDSDSLQSEGNIASRAIGTGINSLKDVMRELRSLQFTSSKPGRGGGYWLTESGRIRAEKLRNK